jgi:hypothetical protein
MKFLTFTCCLLLLSSLHGLCQELTTQSNLYVPTQVFWLDLCAPSDTSVAKSSGRSRYEVNWKSNLSFGLVNINQFRYEYKINTIPFAAFVDTTYGATQRTFKSSIDLSSNPFFIFSVKIKSPNKVNFKRLQKKIDSLNIARESAEQRLAEFTDGFDSEAEIKKTKANRLKYTKISRELYILENKIELEKNKINELSYAQQLATLQQNFIKLTPVATFLFGQTSAYELYAKNIYDAASLDREYISVKSSSRTGSSGMTSSYETNIPKMLSYFQRNAEYIRTMLSKFEILYEKEKNYLTSSQCKCYTAKQIALLDTLQEKFITCKNAFVELSNIYAISPIQDDYLEEYLLTEQQYADKLFSQFMGLSKVTHVNSTYITPTPSNMRNFDIIRIELEKIDKIGNQTEKYDYDIFIKGGLKFDFSAGMFATFLKNMEYNLTYEIGIDKKPTDRKKITIKNQGKVNIGFGGMVNIGVRPGASWVSPALSFGLILDAKPSLQFLSAITLSIGKSERILLHAGCASGFVKRVNDLPLNEYLSSSIIGSSVPLVDRFLVQPFLGLSYNLSKNNVFKVSSFTTSSSNVGNTNQ